MIINDFNVGNSFYITTGNIFFFFKLGRLPFISFVINLKELSNISLFL